MATQRLTARSVFSDFLVERKRINETQLLDALAEHWMSGSRIEESVVKKGYLASEKSNSLRGNSRTCRRSTSETEEFIPLHPV